MKRYLAEAIGTFAMVFAGTGAMVINEITNGQVTHVGVSLTWGLIVMVMIYALGDISGAHFNPAVTIGFWSSGKLAGRSVMPYLLSQLLGAFLASAALLMLFGNQRSLGATLPGRNAWQSFGLETILTAILVLVILQVSHGPKETGVMAGIAVGGVIGLEALFAGPISGASMNPARSLAPAVVSGNIHSVWIYLTAPFAGSLLAVALWKSLRHP